ncbi:MAG: outer membrane protein transport protein [Bdellovibrionales bacterium]|nr:outer membrane protein transport protein [Bdellovibrionales bacterium]
MTPRSTRNTRLALVLVGALLGSSQAFAAGFEKAQAWGAKEVSMGGAVVGSVSGADALYFNPAGLAESSRSGELSVNFSPTLSKFSGANPYQLDSVGGPSRVVDGSSGFSPVFGLLASFKPMPKLGVGAGFYVSGGNKAKFENLDYSGTNPALDKLMPTVETNLAITEAAIGAGYEIMPGLRFGAALRAVMVHANFSTAIYIPGTALYEAQVNDISATRYNAYKLGLQYEEPNHRWGLGIVYRSSVPFTAHGTTTARRELVAVDGIQDVGTGSAAVSNTFPLQIAIGGWTRATELLRIGYEYSYTNYNVDKELAIQGSAGALSLSNIPQQWKNMHVVRVGGEYTGTGLPLRFGYAYTSAVTPSDYARSTFSSPGPGHSLTFGTGMILSNAIDVDGALEYAWAGGDGHNKNAPFGTAEVANDSSFKSHAYAAHLSAKYHF